MTRCLVILVGALWFSPLMAADVGDLFRACRNEEIVMVIQTWSPDTFQNRGLAKQPSFPDGVMELLSMNYPSRDLRVQALIKALAPPLATQDFHIFRVGGVLWIAPQEAPPLFNASLHIAERTLLAVDSFILALAPVCDSTVPPARVQIIGQGQGGIRIMRPESSSLSFDPGDYSLAQALFRFAKVDRDVQGWTLFCCKAPVGSTQQYYFEVIPTGRRSPTNPPPLDIKPLPKIAGGKTTHDLLLRFGDGDKKKWERLR